MAARDVAAARLALAYELRRAGQLLHGDPHAYDDLVTELEAIFDQVDEAERDEGGPLPEEESDA